MSNGRTSQELLDRFAALRQAITTRMGPQLASNPQLADALSQRLDEMLSDIQNKDRTVPGPPDHGLAELVGIGPEAADSLGETRVPPGVEDYDEQVRSERMTAVADLYYIYQHEKIGIFRVVQKLKELFNAGAVRLSRGDGAFHLYQFDRREVLRYTKLERYSAYGRAFGYAGAELKRGGRRNVEFHSLFTSFNNHVALFWRDKRISDVMRTGAFDPSFGSIAIVRRSGLDLRNNLKYTSYGHLNVMRVELMQLLEDAFKILNASDVKNLFGADNAWDVVEEVLVRYFNERLVTSPRQRMAVTGREILRWLAQGHILKQQRAQFEALLLQIAEAAEEWLTSAQSLGLAKRTESSRVLPWGSEDSVVGAANGRPRRSPMRRSGRNGAAVTPRSVTR